MKIQLTGSHLTSLQAGIVNATPRVPEHSPAAHGALQFVVRVIQKFGDTMVGGNSKPVRTVSGPTNAFKETGVGNSASLSVLRQGARRVVTIDLIDIARAWLSTWMRRQEPMLERLQVLGDQLPQKIKNAHQRVLWASNGPCGGHSSAHAHTISNNDPTPIVL